MMRRILGWVWRSLVLRYKWNGPFPYEALRKDPLPTAACVDLGAFRKPLPDYQEIETLVIMEDRQPKFFLSYDGYKPNEKVPLNRHGPYRHYILQKDLKELVIKLHQKKKKVLIGFWAFWSDGIRGPTAWLKKHPELKSRRSDEADIGNPFAVLSQEKIPFVSHIVAQYKKLQKDFQFDGLFLGDGLNGFRNFWDPNLYRDQIDKIPLMTEFYRVIAETIHKSGGELWTYDCRGFSYEEAKLHGTDYRLLSKAGLDILVFQDYPIAWGYYFNLPDKKDPQKSFEAFKTVKQALENTKTLFYYSLELEDTAEKWWAPHEAIKKQMGRFSIADGKFLVWGNETMARNY